MGRLQRQLWYCENCNRDGVVRYAQHADVMSVANLIRQSHTSVSPDCSTGVNQVRVPRSRELLEELRKYSAVRA